MTHAQVKNTNRRWKRNYSAVLNDDYMYIVPKLVKARTVKDGYQSGIHLLNPSKDELAEAFCRAMSQGFRTIVVHTKRTFGKTE